MPARARRQRWLGAAAAGVAVVGLAAWFSALRAPERAVRVESLAVLPLANLSSDPEQEYLSDGTNTGRQAENLAARRRAFELDPLWVGTGSALGQALMLNGRVEEGIAVIERTLELDPDHAVARS